MTESMPDFDVQQIVEAAARAAYDSSQRFNRDSVRAEEWELLPEYWRRIFRAQARAAMAVIVPAVTEQIRALHQQRNIREYEERDCADGICDCHYDDISGAEWCPSRIVSVCSRCYSIAAEDVESELYEWPCEHVRLLAELDAAARGEQP